jgi:heat shock protein HslJ
MGTRATAVTTNISALAAAGLLTLALGITGCASTGSNVDGSAEGAPGDGSMPKQDLTTSPERLFEPDLWRLVELDARPLTMPDGGPPPYLVFDVEDDRVHGFAGCNQFSGVVELRDDGRLRFKDTAATLMACAESVNEIEGVFLAALGDADNFRVVDRVLELRRDGMLPLAVFEAVYGDD